MNPLTQPRGSGSTGFSWMETLRDRHDAVIDGGFRIWLVAVGLLLIGVACLELLPTRPTGPIAPSWLTWISVWLSSFSFALGIRHRRARPIPFGIPVWAGVITISAAIRFSLGSVHPGFATEVMHTLNVLLMVGFALLVPIPMRQGVPLLAAIALVYPLVQLSLGEATFGEPMFAAQVVDLSAGLGISSLVLLIHNRLLRGRSAALNDLARLAEHDALTGVKNRRTLTARIEAECNRSARYGAPLGVLMYDIDNFKRFNSVHGYAIGDQMLRAVAAAIDGVIRLPRFAPLRGIVARYGGEEFAALLPAANAELVERFANESRAAIAARRIQHEGKMLKVTVSVGYSHAPGGVPCDASAMLKAADQALYRAKSTGGNRSLPAREATLTTPKAQQRSRADRAQRPNPRRRAEALYTDNQLLHAVVLRWTLSVAALWILLIGAMDVAFALEGATDIRPSVALAIRVALAATLTFIAWARPTAVWANIRPALLHAFFIIGLAALVTLAMERSGGLTSPYFGQLIYIILGWALAFSVPRAVSVGVLAAVTSLLPLWYVQVHSASLLHYDLVTRTTALVAAAIVAYATQRAFSRTRAEEISARHELEQLARVDPLTGLPNRAAFEERVGALVSRADDDAPLTLVMADLDHFKDINDTHGHLVGDEALATLASVLVETVRTADVPARLGGEEFAVILPMTPVDGAMLTAERLREAIKEVRVQDQISLAASFGVSAWRPGDTPASLFERADTALRRAKANGRDRVELEAGQ